MFLPLILAVFYMAKRMWIHRHCSHMFDGHTIDGLLRTSPLLFLGVVNFAVHPIAVRCEVCAGNSSSFKPDWENHFIINLHISFFLTFLLS